MRAPLFAGFEGAWLHWNGHCTVTQTRHTPEADMTAHYRAALDQGAAGFRDVLPERFDVAAQGCCAEGSTKRGYLLVADPLGPATRSCAPCGRCSRGGRAA